MDNPVSRFINGNTVAYVLYGIIMAGVFEECGRYIVLKYILKKDRTRENAVQKTNASLPGISCLQGFVANKGYRTGQQFPHRL